MSIGTSSVLLSMTPWPRRSNFHLSRFLTLSVDPSSIQHNVDIIECIEII